MKSYKILVAEDDSTNRQLLRGGLKAKKSDDFNVEFDLKIEDFEGNSKDDIIRLFIEEQFDMLIADFKLEGYDYDGGEIISDLHTLNSHIPAIILTAYQEGAIEGADNVLLVMERPENNKEWLEIRQKIVLMVRKFRKITDNQINILERLSKKDSLTKDEELDYMRAGQYLESLKLLKPDLINTALMDQSFIFTVSQMTKTLQEINKHLQERGNDET